MPTFENQDGKRLAFAGAAEVLAYANKIRAAGGANALQALLPSEPSDEQQCLIARALNFGCMVTTLHATRKYPDGSWRWIMVTPDSETTRKLAQAIGARTRWVDEDWHRPLQKGEKPNPETDVLALCLPKRIGNAADAFDHDHPEFAEFVK